MQQNILENIRAKGYVGLDVDFEYLFAEDKDAYVAFIAGTTALLNENGYFCVVALPPKTSDEQMGLLYEGIDYAALGEAANICFIMAYEYVLLCYMKGRSVCSGLFQPNFPFYPPCLCSLT